ncbi:MAG: monovalent cation/H(+) antiporter subunit G [Clostridiaceae bacterium]|nr:monovalent cation/H(+) antiporter subunit G [Clostridiaceae bacterium]
MSDWIRFWISAFFCIAGVLVIIISTFGVYRFRYVLNRMHIAALGDTLGISFILLGLVIAKGFSPVSYKLLLVILFFWIASPVAGHLIARLETTTNEKLTEHVKVKEDRDGSL